MNLRNRLAEIQLVSVEAEIGGDAEFLAVTSHRRAVNGAAGHVADERLKRVGVTLLVVGGVVEQHQALAVALRRASKSLR